VSQLVTPPLVSQAGYSSSGVPSWLLPLWCPKLVTPPLVSQAGYGYAELSVELLP